MEQSSQIVVRYDEHIKNWLKYLSIERGYSPNTVESYRIDVVSFHQFMKAHKGEGVTPCLSELKISDLRSWLASRVAQGFSARSNSRAISGLKSFCRYMSSVKQDVPEFIFKFKSPRVKPLLPRPLTKERVLKVINYIDESQDIWISFRNQALFYLLYGAGLRINEALSLNIEDIDENQSQVRVMGKGRKERVVPLLPIVQKSLSKYLERVPYQQSGSAPIFYGKRGKRLNAAVFERYMLKIRKELGFEDSATPHALRHSFASHLVSKGMGLRSLQELLGHVSLASTQIYTDISDEEMFKVYQATHPLNKRQP